MNRAYPRARQLRRAIERLSGRRLPAFVEGNPDLYLMVKDGDAGERAVGLWNCFDDEAISPTVELDRPYSKIEFIGCRGRLEGTRVILDDIPAWVVRDGKATEIRLYIKPMTDSERAIVAAGCLINYNRNRR